MALAPRAPQHRVERPGAYWTMLGYPNAKIGEIYEKFMSINTIQYNSIQFNTIQHNSRQFNAYGVFSGDLSPGRDVKPRKHVKPGVASLQLQQHIVQFIG